MNFGSGANTGGIARGSGSLRYRRRIPHGHTGGSCLYLSSDESDEELMNAHRSSCAPTAASSSAGMEYNITPPGQESLVMAFSRLNYDWANEFPRGAAEVDQVPGPVEIGTEKVVGLTKQASSVSGSAATAISRSFAIQELVPGVTTTVMIRNIPLRYTPVSLREVIDEEGFQGRYDYFYMPMDFRSHRSLGYCFINFYDAELAVEFATRFENRKFSANSDKLLSVTAAARQGLLPNIASFKLSTLKQMPRIDFRPLVAILGQLVTLDEEVLTWLTASTQTLSPDQKQSTSGLLSMLSDPSLFPQS